MAYGGDATAAHICSCAVFQGHTQWFIGCCWSSSASTANSPCSSGSSQPEVLAAPASLRRCDHPIPILQPKFPGSQLTDHHVSPLCLLYPGPRIFLQPRMGSSVRPKLHLPSQPTLGPSCHLLPTPAPRTFWSHRSNCSKRSQPGEIPQKLQEEQGIQTEAPRCVQISPLAAGHELSEV